MISLIVDIESTMADELEKAINAIKISREEAIHFFNKLEKKVYI